MNTALLLRGVAWLGLYLLLTLLPLAVAVWERSNEPPGPALVEGSIAAGLLAVPLLCFQFALVSRLGPASRPFGSDALMQFHAQIAFLAMAAALLHPAILAGAGLGIGAFNPFSGPGILQTGAIAFWATALIVATSVLRKRLRMSYEVWQVLHLLLAIMILGAMAGHILLTPRLAAAPLTRALLLVYAGLALALLLQYRLVRPLRLWARPWHVVSNEDVGGDTRRLRVRPVGHPGFAFEPGQFAWIITGSGPVWSEQHPISMASSAEPSADGSLEFGIKALGDWSGVVVPRLAPGATLWIDGPFGAFTPEGQPAQGYVLIAGGVGISPLLSILRTMRDREDVRPVLLFHAAHDPSRVAFRDDVLALSADLNLKVVYVYEAPDAEWTGERGYVTADTLRRHLPKSYHRFQYFVCGPRPMMDALDEAFVDIGVSAESVHTERFDMV